MGSCGERRDTISPSLLVEDVRLCRSSSHRSSWAGTPLRGLGPLFGDWDPSSGTGTPLALEVQLEPWQVGCFAGRLLWLLRCSLLFSSCSLGERGGWSRLFTLLPGAKGLVGWLPPEGPPGGEGGETRASLRRAPLLCWRAPAWLLTSEGT